MPPLTGRLNPPPRRRWSCLGGRWPEGRPPSAGGATRCDHPRAAAQDPQQPAAIAPHLGCGLSHPARPVFDAADVGEGLGSIDLLDLVREVIVHVSKRMAKARAATLGEIRTQ